MTTTISSPPSATDTISSGSSSVPYRSANKSGRRKLWIAVTIPTALLLAGIAWATSSLARNASALANVDKFTVMPRSFNVVLKEKGELEAARSTDIVCEVEGRSTIIYLIPEGTAVKKGDLLIELASDEIEDRIRQEELKEANAITAFEAAKTELDIQRDKNASDIRKADLKIELARLALNKYEKGDWEQSLKDAEIEIERAEITLERAKEDYDAAQKLLAKDYVTQTQFEEDEFQYTKAQWDLVKAKKALEVLKEYTHRADLRQRESDLEEAIKERERVAKNAEAEEAKKIGSLEGKQKELALIQDELAKLRVQKEKCRIFAPTQGFVVYYSQGGRHFMMGDNQIKEGASVHERQTLLSLPDTSQMNVKVRVHEAKTDKLSLGQVAMVTVEGLPGRQFTGRVSKIAVLADSQNRWLNPDLKEYETEIQLDPTDAPLKPGVTAYVKILVESVADKLAVPVQSVYAKSGRQYVFYDRHREVVPVEIQLGAIGTEWAEVAEGLASGDQILLAFSDEHKRLIPDLPPPAGRRGMPRGPGGPDGAAGKDANRSPSGKARAEAALGKVHKAHAPRPAKSAGSP